MLLGLATAQTPAEPLDAAGLDPQTELARARAEERGILDQLAQLDSQLAQLGAEAAMLQGRVSELQDLREQHSTRLDAADRRLEALKSEVRGQLRVLYRMHRQGLAPVLFGAQDPTDLRRRARYLVALLESDLIKLRDFRNTLAERKAAVMGVEQSLGELNQLRAALEGKEQQIRDQREVKVELMERARTRKDLALRVIAEYDAARGGFVRQLDAGADRWGMGGSATDWMGVAPPQLGGAHALQFRDAYGQLPWPVSGRVVRRFGTTTDPSTGQRIQSSGVAIASNLGESVRAVFRGQVIMAGYVKGLGETVAVRHGDYTTVYTHLNGRAVASEQIVEQGQVIGFVGNSGLTRGEGFRLGFELRYNKSPQDPLPWLDGRR